MSKRPPPAPPCPSADLHTWHPRGYVDHAAWAEEMLLTHHQERCPACDLLTIWVPTPGAPTDLPPFGRRFDHKQCGCCQVQPGCECWDHRPLPDSWWAHHLAVARKRRDDRKKETAP